MDIVWYMTIWFIIGVVYVMKKLEIMQIVMTKEILHLLKAIYKNTEIIMLRMTSIKILSMGFHEYYKIIFIHHKKMCKIILQFWAQTELYIWIKPKDIQIFGATVY